MDTPVMRWTHYYLRKQNVVSNCLNVTRLRPANPAKRIEVLLRVVTPRSPRNIVLHGVPIAHGEGVDILLVHYYAMLVIRYLRKILILITVTHTQLHCV